MSADDNIDKANEQGLDADAATQSDLWTGRGDRHDDGFRRDQFGNRIDDNGNRVDGDGRPVDSSGDRVNEEGQRLDADGRPLDDGPGGLMGGVIPPIPPMMGR
ncbi:MAG: hypothetical protein Q4P15_07130 [Propionibacteriaceae bacterium]|nr:hypothetical protein [Propionibacteriaceae bacterium]